MVIDEARYKNWESWKPRRWAWEFLIRNAEFQMECDAAGTCDGVARQNVADRFGLKTYKHYSERFSSIRSCPSVRAPKFVAGAISVHSNAENLEAERKVRLSLKPGQVAIVFDVSNGAVNGMGLELQINRATRSLISRALNYSSSFTFRSTQQKLDSHSKVFLKYLKLLDALRSIQTK
ncbi:hypothetical protein, partial [Polynucleobacter sp. 39-46-10]